MMLHCNVWSRRFWMQSLAIFLTLCLHFIQIGAQIDPTKCGRRGADNTFLIHRGTEAPEGHWPWHATIYKVINNNKLDYLCGGSIVDRHTIISSAHCFSVYNFGRFTVLREDQIAVHVGRVDLNATNENIQELYVAKIIMHPEFKSPDIANDIAILKLSSVINITYFVRPVCLWSTDDDQNQIVGTNGTVIGFGLNEKDKKSYTLQEATLTVVDVYTCLERDRKTYGRVLIREMFCAGAKNNVSPCNGDSGGGLFFNINGTWFLRGIVSFIPGRPNTLPKVCDSSKYTVFTDVTKYRRFILQHKNNDHWLQELQPCQDVVIAEDTVCNAASGYFHDFLIAATVEGIFYVLYDGRSIPIVHIDGMIKSINYNCVGGRIFWTLLWDKHIYSADWYGHIQKPFISKDIDEPLSLAVDWISHHLYWSDLGRKTIEVACLDNPDVRTILFTNVSARNIAVDSYHGKLYWTDGGKIEWSNIDGSARQLLIGGPRIPHPYIKYMRVSIATDELCYFGKKARTIQCINAESKRNRTVVSNISPDLTNFFVTDELFYWMDRNSDKIESMDHYGVLRNPIHFNSERKYYHVDSATSVCPVFHSQCAIENGGCPNNTICLLSRRDPAGKICKPIET